MIVKPYRAEHFERLLLQGAQEYLRPHLDDATLRGLETPHAISLFEGDEVLGVGGAAENWNNRATVWAYLREPMGARRMAAVHRTAREFLESLPYRRLEATVVCGFDPGQRWVRMLGFKLECERMTAYDPAGRDCALYARVK